VFRGSAKGGCIVSFPDQTRLADAAGGHTFAAAFDSRRRHRCAGSCLIERRMGHAWAAAPGFQYKGYPDTDSRTSTSSAAGAGVGISDQGQARHAFAKG